MAVAHDAQTRFPAGTGTDATTGTREFTHTPTGTPKGVVVVIGATGTAAPVTGVLYGGIAMTLKVAADDTAEPGTVEIYTLTDTDIPTGAQTVTLQGCTSAPKFVTCSTVTAATTQTTVSGTAGKNTTTGADPFVNITLADAGMIYGGLHGGATTPGSYTLVAGFTAQFSRDYGALSGRHDRSTDALSAGVQGFAYTGASDDYCIACVALSELAAPTVYNIAAALDLTPTLADALTRETFVAASLDTTPVIADALTRETFIAAALDAGLTLAINLTSSPPFVEHFIAANIDISPALVAALGRETFLQIAQDISPVIAAALSRETFLQAALSMTPQMAAAMSRETFMQIALDASVNMADALQMELFSQVNFPIALTITVNLTNTPAGGSPARLRTLLGAGL